MSGNEDFPCIFLVHNSRNDYGFRSLFDCYYLKDRKTRLKNIWSVRIIQKWERKTELPQEFKILEKDKYFSRAVNWSLYKKLDEEIPDKKEDILKSLQDICFFDYNRLYIEKLNDPILIEWYDCSLYREDYFWISSTHLEDAKKTIENILSLSASTDDNFLHLLLYGSLITTLESYIWDTFRSEVMSTENNMKRFLDEYKPKGSENKTSLSDIYLKGNWLSVNEFIRDYIKKEMDQIIFHKLDLVKELFRKILLINSPEDMFSFQEDIQNRHDIFHRNGKKATGWELQIDNKIIQNLWLRVLSFINKMEEAITVQRKTVKENKL